MTPVLEAAVGTRKFLRVQTGARLRTRAGLAGLLGALVVGILGMHALPSHGTPPPVTAAAAAPTAASSTNMTGMSTPETAMDSGDFRAGHPHAAPNATTDSSMDSATPKAGTAVDAGGSGHDTTSMVMLLAAAALTLLALLVIGFLRPLRPAAFKPAAARERALQWVRGTGPPTAWQFSVIRC